MTYSTDSVKPLAIDLFAGLGGWTEGLLAVGACERTGATSVQSVQSVRIAERTERRAYRAHVKSAV